MKKIFIPVLVILAVAIIAGAGLFVKRPQNSPFQWETKPRAVLQDFTKAHDPKISIAPSGDILLLAAGQDAQSGPLQLFISRDGGDTFGAGVPVSDADAKLHSNGENSPILVNGTRGPAVLWDQNSTILFARSMDDGASFSDPVKVNDTTNASAYAGDLVADGKVLFAAWLDGRDRVGNGTSSIYSARSTDGGATWQKNVRITQNACPCCRPNLTVLNNGHVVAMWRNVYPEQIRDMSCAVSTDGGQTWSEPRRVAEDNWHILGCPVSGPHLAISGKRLFATWYSEGTGKDSGVRLSWSDDEGATWSKPEIVSVHLQDAMQPNLYATTDGKITLVFRARDPKDGDSWSQLRTYIVTVGQNGQTSPPLQLPGQNSVAYPAVAADNTGRFWIAWNGNHTVQFLRGRESTS